MFRPSLHEFKLLKMDELLHTPVPEEQVPTSGDPQQDVPWIPPDPLHIQIPLAPVQVPGISTLTHEESNRIPLLMTVPDAPSVEPVSPEPPEEPSSTQDLPLPLEPHFSLQEWLQQDYSASPRNHVISEELPVEPLPDLGKDEATLQDLEELLGLARQPEVADLTGVNAVNIESYCRDYQTLAWPQVPSKTSPQPGPSVGQEIDKPQQVASSQECPSQISSSNDINQQVLEIYSNHDINQQVLEIHVAARIKAIRDELAMSAPPEIPEAKRTRMASTPGSKQDGKGKTPGVPLGSAGMPWKGLTFKHAQKLSALDPKKPPFCTGNHMCPVPTHGRIGVFGERHQVLSDLSKFPVLCLFMFAITEFFHGERICRICKYVDKRKPNQRGDILSMLQHAAFHADILSTCATENEIISQLHFMIKQNTRYAWSCLVIGCKFVHRNRNMLYFHYAAVHKTMPTECMIFCPFCLASLIGKDFLVHINEVKPEHVFTCCTPDTCYTFAEWTGHYIAMHLRELLQALDLKTRHYLLELWQNPKSNSLFRTSRVPILSATSLNLQISSLYDRVLWPVEVDTIHKLVYCVKRLNEVARIQDKLSTAEQPTYSLWRSMKHEFLEYYIWENLCQLLAKVITITSFSNRSPESMTRADKRRWIPSFGEDEQDEPPPKAFVSSIGTGSRLHVLKTKLQMGVPKDPVGLIMTTSLGIWSFSPETRTAWVNLSHDVECDIHTHVVNGVLTLENREGDFYVSEQSYFHRIYKALSISSWKEDMIVILEFPFLPLNLDMDDIFLKASAYAAQVETLQMKYPDYHFISVLPLLARSKCFQEQVELHTTHMQRCALISMILMQVKHIAIPLSGMVEREPCEYKKPAKQYRWQTAICDYPVADESTRTAQGKPSPEMRRRLGVLLDQIAAAKAKMLERCASLSEATDKRRSFQRKEGAFLKFFDFGFSKRVN